jgi:hypothetical protein
VAGPGVQAIFGAACHLGNRQQRAGRRRFVLAAHGATERQQRAFPPPFFAILSAVHSELSKARLEEPPFVTTR